MDIREIIKDNPLLFDGGMGTYFAARHPEFLDSCESANLTHPDWIRQIHEEYLEAGCQAIKTNTFGVNRIACDGKEDLTEKLLAKGVELAREAMKKKGKKAFLFGDIGPVGIQGEREEEAAIQEYCWIADRFLDLGVGAFLFETNDHGLGLLEAAAHIRRKKPEAFILISFAVGADGFTRAGAYYLDLIRQMKESPLVDGVGLNCACGAGHMRELAKKMETGEKFLSLMPNAGYPMIRNHRTFYGTDPLYFASELEKMAKAGCHILGGCCGTTPTHMREAALLLERLKKNEKMGKEREGEEKVLIENLTKGRQEEESETQTQTDGVTNSFWRKLRGGKKVIAVELDPPADVTLDRFMKGAKELKTVGADSITIADCPIGRARMDSSILACKLRRELEVDPLPHMTCRDRNLNATKALLLGLFAEGVRNVLVVTGDPVPTAERDEVKSVYQFHSRKMAAFISSLNENILPEPFHIFGALDVNARNFHVQLRLAKEKEEKGVIGFLTQPILTSQALENLKKARQELKGFLLGGIIPVVSKRNGIFMENEINGIRVDQKIIEMYEGKDRAEAEALAEAISIEVARQIAPYVDGFYLMTPFGRTGLMSRIIEKIKNLPEMNQEI